MVQSYSILYAIPYIIFFLLLVILSGLEFRNINLKAKSRGIKYTSLILILTFIGLRGFVYTDWATYYPIFEKLPTITSDSFSFENLLHNSFNTNYEIGFITYTCIIKSILNDYFVWVFINTLIDIIILYKIFNKYTNYLVFAFIIYLISRGLAIEFNLYRNVKAILLFALSIKYVEKGNPIKYIMINSIGILFHSSSIIYLPLYFILKKNPNKKIIFSLFIIGNIIYALQIEYIKPFIEFIGSVLGGRISGLIYYYTNSEYSTEWGFTIGYIERTITFILTYYFYYKYPDKFTKPFVNLLFIYIFTYLFFSELYIIPSRVSILFVISYPIVYAQILSSIETRRNKEIFLYILLCYIILKATILHTDITSKYDNLLFGIERYENRMNIFINNNH